MLSRPLLSLCMIVKNEARNLPRCLASVAGVVDEIVVVDTGSTDDSPRIAEAAGARVVFSAWENDFARARNGAMGHGTGAWILILDADEELDGSFREGVRDVLSATSASALRVVVENLSPSGDVARSTEAPSVRVVRNDPRFRYERSIHEQITPSVLRAGGTIADVELRVLHHGYTCDVAQGGSRAERNLTMLEAELARCPEDAGLRVHLALAAKAKGDFARARRELAAAVSVGGAQLPPDARGRALTALAQVELAAGAHASADRNACEALALDPENLAAAHVAAVARCLGGDLRGAVPLLERLLAAASTTDVVRGDVVALLALARRAA